MLGPTDALGSRPSRVLVAGTSGSGKSAIAARIAELLGIPHVEIDALYHGQNWEPRPTFESDVAEFSTWPTWVTEWQYRHVRLLLSERADLAVWLDLPRRTVMRQVTRRTVRRRLRREPLWNDNREPPLWTIVHDGEHIIRWAWSTHHQTGPRVLDLAERRPELPIVRLRSHREAKNWLIGPLAATSRQSPRPLRSVGDMTTPPSTPPAPSSPSSGSAAQERADLVDVLRKHRDLFRHTVGGLTDEQARLTPTASTLCLGGLVKHVAAVEQQWASFVVDGPAPSAEIDWASIDWANPPPEVQQYVDGFRMLDGESLAGLLARYDEVAAATDELVLSTDLDARQPLPVAPWFEPGATWSARRVFTHILAETAQHAGHADIIRETIDGQQSMG
jgi:adenylate kinase family enzyme